MKTKNRVMAVIIVMLMLMTLGVAYASETGITVKIDGKDLIMDVKPVLIDERVLVPFRAIFEEYGSKDIEWDNKTRTATGSINGILLELKVDTDIVKVNGVGTKIDVPAKLIEERIMVPLRFVSETIGLDVGWDQKTQTVYIGGQVEEVVEQEEVTIVNTETGKGLYIGIAEKDILSKLGNPDRKDISEQGYVWYIYNKDIVNYMQVGIENNKVVAFATNSTNWEVDGVKVGTSVKEIREKHKYLPELDIYKSYEIPGENYITNYIVDIHNDSKVSTIYITGKGRRTEKNYTEQVLKGLALQLHDLTNVYRERNGLSTLKLDTKLIEVATYHCNDMANNNHFDHKSFNGDGLDVRMELIMGTRYGIGENLASGHPNALYASTGLYNSKGHRDNILLAGYTHSGTCAKISSSNQVYYAHNFMIKE